MENIKTNQDFEKEIAQLDQNLKGAAKWFYWIAGLSVINTLINYLEGGVSFIIGLGITQLIEGIVYDASTEFKLAALVIEILISGMFAIFGYFAIKREKWAFIVGMIFYFMDGLIFLLVNDWLSIGFHAFVLFSLFSGVKSLKKIEELEYVHSGGLSQIQKELSKT
ncbi:MAG: hypothetical protein P8X42_06625 [Calditrichaceae bacterium]